MQNEVSVFANETFQACGYAKPTVMIDTESSKRIIIPKLMIETIFSNIGCVIFMKTGAGRDRVGGNAFQL